MRNRIGNISFVYFVLLVTGIIFFMLGSVCGLKLLLSASGVVVGLSVEILIISFTVMALKEQRRLVFGRRLFFARLGLFFIVLSIILLIAYLQFYWVAFTQQRHG